MRQILILIIFLLIKTNTLADKKFEKDLKKISKDSAFIDNAGKVYSVDKIDNKENIILKLKFIDFVQVLEAGQNQNKIKCGNIMKKQET